MSNYYSNQGLRGGATIRGGRLLEGGRILEVLRYITKLKDTLDDKATNFYLDYEDSLSPPPSTPAPTTTTVPAVVPLRKAVDKKMLDEATYAALLSEKAKYDAEVEHLKEKTACVKLRRELLQIELFEKKRYFEEVRAEDLMKT